MVFVGGRVWFVFICIQTSYPRKSFVYDFLTEILSRVLTVFSADSPYPIKEEPPETSFIKDLQKSHKVVEFKLKSVKISEHL